MLNLSEASHSSEKHFSLICHNIKTTCIVLSLWITLLPTVCPHWPLVTNIILVKNGSAVIKNITSEIYFVINFHDASSNLHFVIIWIRSMFIQDIGAGLGGPRCFLKNPKSEFYFQSKKHLLSSVQDQSPTEWQQKQTWRISESFGGDLLKWVPQWLELAADKNNNNNMVRIKKTH